MSDLTGDLHFCFKTFSSEGSSRVVSPYLLEEIIVNVREAQSRKEIIGFY